MEIEKRCVSKGVKVVRTSGFLLCLTMTVLASSAAQFASPIFVSSGPSSTPQGVAVADVNNDSKLDILTVSQVNSRIYVFLGNGDGTFGSPTNYATGSGAYFIALGDLNNDTSLDVVTANFGLVSPNNTVSVLLNRGNGTFTGMTNFTVGLQPYAVALADFNEDGKLDAATVNYGGATVSILAGEGDGRFQSATSFTVTNNGAAITVGDFNRDGHVDLATAHYLRDALAILPGNGNGTFSNATILNVPVFQFSSALVSRPRANCREWRKCRHD